MKPMLCVCSIFFLTVSTASFSQSLETSNNHPLLENKKVLFLGNSFTYYNNSVSTHVREIAKAVLPDNAKGYAFRSATISSGRLGWHFDTLKFQTGLQKWDAVLFQGQSIEPISKNEKNRNYFLESARQMSNFSHKHGQNVIYVMSWGFSEKDDFNEIKEMTEQLSSAYIKIAQETNGLVAPVGLAFIRAQQEHPIINLYAKDKKHPSPEGTYLAANVIFSTLYNISPIGAPLPQDFNFSEQTAKILQEIAWKTVKDFQETFQNKRIL